jgi:hypothetical protein
MAEVQQAISETERQNYDSLCRTIRGFSLCGPAYIGGALPFIYAAAGVYC